MTNEGPRGHPRSRPFVTTVILGSLIGLLSLPASATASPYPVLPISESNQILQGLAVPALIPGGEGSLRFSVHNPLTVPIFSVQLAFGEYVFNGFPGSSVGPLPSDAPTLTNGTTTGIVVGETYSTLIPSASVSGSIGVVAPSAAPRGLYAIRTSVSFVANGTPYLLESRGYFSQAQWLNATSGPGGVPTLNVSRLGVSGVTPETAVPVMANSPSPWLYGILGAAVILAGVGGYYSIRPGPGSRSGARKSREGRRAASALGNNRTSEGD